MSDTPTTKPTPQRELVCPMCSTDLTIEWLFSSTEAAMAFNRLLAISVPMGSRVLSYLTLFAPAKNRLSLHRKVVLLQPLLPDMQRMAITKSGRDWPAPHAAWNLAIEQMLAARDAGKLQLPLTNHAYLYTILQGMADKVERSSEAELEAARRNGPGHAAPRQSTVTVRGEAMPIGQALAQVYGGQDPALAKLDADAKTTSTASPEMRAKLAALRAGPLKHAAVRAGLHHPDKEANP